MSTKVERTVKLDPDAAELLIQLAGSPRKQGEYLSALIREKAQEQQTMGTRLAAVEQELAHLKAALAQRDSPLELAPELPTGGGGPA